MICLSNVTVEDVQRGLAGQCEVERVQTLAHFAAELLTEQRLDIRLIIDHQHSNGHARLPPFVNIWRGKVTTNSVNAPTSLSTVIVPPCCFVTMS